MTSLSEKEERADAQALRGLSVAFQLSRSFGCPDRLFPEKTALLPSLAVRVTRSPRSIGPDGDPNRVRSLDLLDLLSVFVRMSTESRPGRRCREKYANKNASAKTKDTST